MDNTSHDLSSSGATQSPVGDGDYLVEQGDCVSSIAYEHGLPLDAILSDPANQDLKRARKNFRTLLPGDHLTIPPVREKQIAATTDERHKFRVASATETFHLRLLDSADQPRANLNYRLIIGQRTYSGVTNHFGELTHSILPNAREGRLILGKGRHREVIELALGELDPKDTISGVQARLQNLGLDCGPIDGIFGPLTRGAICRFQKINRLEPSGELDDTTIQHLADKHGS